MGTPDSASTSKGARGIRAMISWGGIFKKVTAEEAVMKPRKPMANHHDQ
jgi:hypothetical protein